MLHGRLTHEGSAMTDWHASNAQSAPAAQWPTHTHWSVVLTAGDPAAPGARMALEELCRAYWYPVYAYVRRRGYAWPDAEDLTQSFFLHLLETRALAAATPERGRFRAFLRGAADRFIVDEWRHDNALKRGRRTAFLSWEGLHAEERYARETDAGLTAERLFDRSWAENLLQRVLDRLKGELAVEGRASLFEALKDRLLGAVDGRPYGDLVQQLGTTQAALQKTVQRLRVRFRESLRDEIAQTVAPPDNVEDELRYLMVVLSA